MAALYRSENKLLTGLAIGTIGAGILAAPSSPNLRPNAWIPTLAPTLMSPAITPQEAKARPTQAIIDDKVVQFASEEEKFAELAKIWKKFNRGKSIINYNHFAYFQIVAMGRPAVPYLLREVASGAGTWYVALQYITGEMAESPEMRGAPDAVRRAWLAWGVQNDCWADPDQA